MAIFWLWGKNPYGLPENLNFVSSDQPSEPFRQGIDEIVYGSMESNRVDAKSGNDTIIGDMNNEGIRDTEAGAADVLNGGAGSDWIAGGGGDDEIHGGPDTKGVWVYSYATTPQEEFGPLHPANQQFYYFSPNAVYRDLGDTIYGDGGNDKIWGDGGDDKVWGGLGDDEIYGSPGNDWINGQSNNDAIYGDEGPDTIVGEGEDDTVFGGTGKDLIYGSDGADWLNGQQDDDRIYGEAGDDILIGEDGADELVGGFGRDYMTGGTATTSMFTAIALVPEGRRGSTGSVTAGTRTALARSTGSRRVAPTSGSTWRSSAVS